LGKIIEILFLRLKYLKYKDTLPGTYFFIIIIIWL